MSEQEPSYTKPLKADLEAIFHNHEKWLNSNGHEGNPAILENLDLTKTHLDRISFSLYGKNLSKAFIENVNFTGSYLESVKLIGADLKRVTFESAILNKSTLVKANCYDCSFNNSFILDADLSNSTFEKCQFKKAKLAGSDLKNSKFPQSNFEEAYLLRTKLDESNFQDSNFEKVTGLLGSQLAGTDLSGAKISEDIRKFEGLARIEELSKKAGKLFILMLVGCLYSWLTIATTTDSQLFLDSKYYDLPIIQTAIPITPFFYVAPLILLGIYIWFHLYLQRLWEEMAALPAIFPDGKALDQKVFPWLLSGFIRAYIPLLKTNLPDLFGLQFIASLVLAWGLVPFILSEFWVRVIPTHDETFILTLASIFSISLGFGIYFFSLARLTLDKSLKRPRIFGISFSACLFALLILVLVSRAAVNITTTSEWWPFYLKTDAYSLEPRHPMDQYLSSNLAWSKKINYALLEFLQELGLRTYPKFYRENLTQPPESWPQDFEHISKIEGADFRGKNLRHLYAEGGFWANSRFNGADLSYAFLMAVYLGGADFSRSNLTGALMLSTLENAKLLGANLANVRMGGKYKKADFRGANFGKAFIINADFSQTFLAGTTFESAIFDAVNFEQAIFSGPYPIFDNQASIESPGISLVIEKTKEGTSDFSNAVFRFGNFNKTNLEGVKFFKTKFFDVDLSGSQGLAQAQIDEACVDEKTKLPVGIKRPNPCP
ncbi:pentapeptide repeat-containing protein [Candidatus Nitrospira neomarina]|uniref:Pentapeptide repeat-containing protein n=1 Tax=Candidatus Nitrospira neomarina TaxID=3020899 RepID=A0AA96GJG4_9BACT|nr:pentapeptide repeat-containing protein [Candidatus Nitrospira neomarina]WNM62467.1 pentapeptide repeat-containing protein [Candidatus Nitrospira neomarina]